MPRWVGLAAMVAALSLVAAQSTAAEFGSQPPAAGWVSNQATAVAIARAVFTSVFGAKMVATEEPLHAARDGSVWHVWGTLHCKDCVGGVMEVMISARDGRIVRLFHSQ